MLEHLTAALGGNGPDEARHAAALRLRCDLQPVAGPGARIMPPTYAGDRDSPTYVHEERRIGDVNVDCVLLDSVASQSNRLEEALLQLMGRDDVPVPDVVVDQAEFGRNSALSFSHRVFDAWIEDALLEGVPFGTTDQYAALSSVINRGVAGPLLERFPIGLLLGCWASRKSNPQGTTRIARAITSEIIAVDAVPGVRSSSKIDRHHVSAGVKLAKGSDGERFRVLTDGGPVPKGVELVGDKAGKKGDGRPSTLGYGNVTPSVNKEHGGVTMSHAQQHTVISLAALRATRAQRVGEARSPSRDLAGRLALASLALLMLEAQVEQGWELRSGCHLVPTAEPTVEMVGRLGKTVASWPLLGLNAGGMLGQSVAAASAQGLDWMVPPLGLTASDAQLELLRLSLNRSDPDEGTES